MSSDSGKKKKNRHGDARLVYPCPVDAALIKSEPLALVEIPEVHVVPFVHAVLVAAVDQPYLPSTAIAEDEQLLVPQSELREVIPFCCLLATEPCCWCWCFKKRSCIRRCGLNTWLLLNRLLACLLVLVVILFFVFDANMKETDNCCDSNGFSTCCSESSCGLLAYECSPPPCQLNCEAYEDNKDSNFLCILLAIVFGYVIIAQNVCCCYSRICIFFCGFCCRPPCLDDEYPSPM